MLKRVPVLFVGVTVLTCLFAQLSPRVFAGEKIQFYVPNESERPAIETGKAKKPEVANTGLETPAETPDTLIRPAPIKPPVRRDPKAEEERDRKENWIFLRAEDMAPKLEDVYKLKSYDALDKNRAFEEEKGGVVSRFFEEPKTESKDENSGRPFQNEETEGSFRKNESSDSLQDQWRHPAANRSSLGDLWSGEKTSLSDYYKTMERNLERRNEFRQLLEQRVGGDPINSLSDATRQPANPIIGTPGDPFTRPTQAGVPDQWNGGASFATGRSQLPDSPNTRALVPNASSMTPTIQETPRARPQPVVLPFPKRSF